MSYPDATDYHARLAEFIHRLEGLVDDEGDDIGCFGPELRDQAFSLAKEGEEILNARALEEADVESDRASWGVARYDPDEEDDDDDVLDSMSERLDALGLPALEKSEFPTQAREAILILESILDEMEMSQESEE